MEKGKPIAKRKQNCGGIKQPRLRQHSVVPSKVIALSVEIGNLIGRPVRPPSSAGELRNELGELFQWHKCPKHGTWMQPEWKPFKLWRCGVVGKTKEVKDTSGHSGGFAWFNERCEFTRAAKLRTVIERRIFTLAWALDQL